MNKVHSTIRDLEQSSLIYNQFLVFSMSFLKPRLEMSSPGQNVRPRYKLLKINTSRVLSVHERKFFLVSTTVITTTNELCCQVLEESTFMTQRDKKHTFETHDRLKNLVIFSSNQECSFKIYFGKPLSCKFHCSNLSRRKKYALATETEYSNIL